jgi:uncharacterized protein involved in high-affinity Fe2+ transport
MSKIPTIDEIAATIYQPIKMSCNEFAIELAKKVAKIHVQAALEAAADNVYMKKEESYIGGLKGDGMLYETIEIVDRDSILTAYPLKNII